jgi:hypothetical protein
MSEFQFKKNHMSFGKFKGMPFEDICKNKDYNNFLKNIPDEKKTKAVKYYLLWLENNEIDGEKDGEKKIDFGKKHYGKSYETMKDNLEYIEYLKKMEKKTPRIQEFLNWCENNVEKLL